MGYYTNYDTSGNSEEIKAAINEASGYINVEDDCIKWYDHEEHMKEVSLKFPDQLLVLEGDGEEQGDQWKAYYKNGKVQVCKAIITFEEFDEKKLK